MSDVKEWLDEIDRMRKPKPTLRNAPLRKVIGTLQVEAGEFMGEMLYYNHELLECFHHQMPKQDFIGEYHAARRRCGQCAEPQEQP